MTGEQFIEEFPSEILRVANIIEVNLQHS